MKKTILSALFAIMALTASAQVNAVGIPFGIGKSKAVELLNSKYGAYDYYDMDLIMYEGFRLDGVAYEYANFHFEDMVFTEATFSMQKHTEAANASADAKRIAEALESYYNVVNLAEYGAAQSKTIGGTTIATLYRAVPKNTPIVNGKAMPQFYITIIAFADAEGIQIVTRYSPTL